MNPSHAPHPEQRHCGFQPCCSPERPRLKKILMGGTLSASREVVEEEEEEEKEYSASNKALEVKGGSVRELS